MTVRGLALFATIVCCTGWSADFRTTGFALSATRRILIPSPLENDGQALAAAGARQNSFDLLSELVAEELHFDNAFLGRTRFDINDKDHTFLLDLSPVPRRAVLSENDHYAVVLEALIRTKSLQRDFQKALPKDKFWVGPLDSVEAAVRRCSDQIDNQDSFEAQQTCSSNIEEQFKQLGASVQTYTAALKLAPTSIVQERGVVSGYRVQIKIDPPLALVKVMTALEYKKCIAFRTALDDQWNDLLDGDNEMIGRYHYRANWPAELNGPEEGNFEIRQPTTLTFRPNRK